MRPTSLCLAVVASAVIGFALGGCDQQQPIAEKPPVDPGSKPGETPPVEPDKRPAPVRDNNIPLPPATAPTIPGDPNHPSIPPALPPPPPTASPTGSPTETPALIPQANEHTTTVSHPTTPSSSDLSGRVPSTRGPANATNRDELINAKIYRAITSQPGLSSDGSVITISTIEGEVTLRGSVASITERDHIVALAGQVAGVRAINNRLDITGP